ncbi:MAG: molybdopterin-binding protein [Myxococcota bacterium]|nr:molybdopterin-binding protein [Myxococcota bacterium]
MIVSIIIIGDEILSAKFKDENTPWLIQRCNEIGLQIRHIQIIPDELERISEAVRKASASSDFVITTGGVGPTHDDKTMEGIAKAFQCGLCTAPELATLIIEKIGNRPGPLRMALVPDIYTIWDEDNNLFPQVVVKNVIVLPGIPKLMRLKFNSIAHRLKGKKKHIQKIYLQARESDIAIRLAEIQNRYPNVDIGSYPRYPSEGYNLILTAEAFEEAPLDKCLEELNQSFSSMIVSDAKSSN